MGRVELVDLAKVFGSGDNEIVAVDNLDIDITDGEFVVFVGPSGCGKSTTLRCIAGLETVTEGDILLDGRSIINEKPTERDIAMVFQNYALYPHMSSFDNMAFGLKMTTDLSEKEIDERVNDAAEMMGIKDLLNKKPGSLSGGQQQRVALGRSIVRDPEVFLLDEPLSNLDAKLRTQMRTELQRLQEELRVTTIYVTHDQTEAMTMGDKIVVLKDGELQQLGTPLECYHEPANQFVAGFIGSPSMNFVDVERQDTTLAHGAFNFELTTDTVDQLRNAPTHLTLGIRPEDIQVLDNGESYRNAIDATVDVVEPMGDETVLYVSIGDEPFTVNTSGDQIHRVGEKIQVLFPEDRIHLFDGQTGDTVMNREWSPAEEDTVVEA